MVFERFEQAARGLLWLALAFGCVVVPLGYLRAAGPDPRLEVAQRKRAPALDEAADKTPKRFEGDLGMSLSGIDWEKGTTETWFTNVSPRSGFACLQSTVTNTRNGASTQSLPVCKEVAPYASVQISMTLAAAELDSVCPQPSECKLSVLPVPDAAERPVDPTPPRPAHPKR